MNRQRVQYRINNFVMAKWPLKKVFIVPLILLVVYPTTTLFRINTIPSSTVFVQRPDAPLGTYQINPSVIDREAPSGTLAKIARLLENNVALRHMIPDQYQAIFKDCTGKTGEVLEHIAAKTSP